MISMLCLMFKLWILIIYGQVNLLIVFNFVMLSVMNFEIECSKMATGMFLMLIYFLGLLRLVWGEEIWTKLETYQWLSYI